MSDRSVTLKSCSVLLLYSSIFDGFIIYPNFEDPFGDLDAECSYSICDNLTDSLTEPLMPSFLVSNKLSLEIWNPVASVTP